VGRYLIIAILTAVICSGCIAGEFAVDSFTYSSIKAAQNSWIPSEAGEPCRPVLAGKLHRLRLVCNFQPDSRRARWDKSVALDLSDVSYFKISLRIENLTAVDHISLHFKSGEGWYSNGNVMPVNSEEWQHMVFAKSSFGTEGECGGWDKISTIRISVWQSRNARAAVEISDFSAVQASITENLLRNSGFETCTSENIPDYWGSGHFGFAPEQWAYRMDEWRTRWGVDNTISHSGNRSLRIVGSEEPAGLQAYSCFAYPTGSNKPYTFSAWLKSDAKDMTASLQFSGSPVESLSIPGDNRWRRYSITAIPVDAFGEANQQKTWCIVTPQKSGNLWIDDTQFELGTKATDYRPAIEDASIIGPAIKRQVPGTPDLPLISLPGKTTVSIDSSRRFLVNSKPFIPFAVGWESTPTKNVLKSIAQSGFNTVCYTIYPWNYNDLIPTMDYARSCGLMVIPWINSNITPDVLKQIVITAKDHPALLVWYVCDEPASINSDVTTKYEIAKTNDPNHPAYVNYSILFADYTYGDIASMDRYPLPSHSPATMYMDADNMERVASINGKPSWIWLQSCGYIAWMSREPTAPELECMTYISLIHGVRGFKIYAHKPHTSTLWNEMKWLAREIKILTPVLYSLESSTDAIASPSTVHVVTKKLNGKTYIIAVNERPTPVTAQFKLSSVVAKTATVLFEKRLLKVSRDVIRDKFAGYQRHVYCIE